MSAPRTPESKIDMALPPAIPRTTRADGKGDEYGLAAMMFNNQQWQTPPPSDPFAVARLDNIGKNLIQEFNAAAAAGN